MFRSSVYYELSQSLDISVVLHNGIEQSSVVMSFEESLSQAMKIVQNNVTTPDLLMHNDIHQACIHFDRARLAKSEKEQERFDNMLSENLSARDSIQAIQQDPEGYRQRVEQAYAPYRKVLRTPAKEASVTAYKNISRQLGHLKLGANSKIVKDYFTARQDLLRADLDLIVDLQCKALGLEAPKKSKNATFDKGMSIER